MASVSAVENHPQKKKIIDLIIAQTPVREIAERVSPPVHFLAIQRYKKNVVAPAIAQRATAQKVKEIPEGTRAEIVEARNETRQIVAGNPVLDRLRRKYDRYDRVIQKAEDSEDYKAVASLDRAETASLELEGKFTGMLANEGPKTQVQIVIGVTEATPQAVRIQVDDENVIDLTPR